MENNRIENRSEALRTVETVYLTVSYHLNLVCSLLADNGLLEASEGNDVITAIQDVNADPISVSKILESEKDILDISKLVDFIIDQKDGDLFNKMIAWYPYKSFPREIIIGKFCSEEYESYANKFETELERMAHNAKMVSPDRLYVLGDKGNWEAEEYERIMIQLKTGFKMELESIWEQHSRNLDMQILCFGVPEPKLWERCNSKIQNEFGYLASAMFPHAELSVTDKTEIKEAKLSTDVRKVLDKAINAGFVEEQDGIFTWKSTKDALSYFGYRFNTNALTEKHWKLMETVFGQAAKNLAQTFGKNHFHNCMANTDEEKEIDKLFII